MDYSLERSGRDEANYERDHLSSSILNEDTDDFIVGDRVWVNGTTPGYIQFIGETKFSPGEWAGIVLDKPVGKHSGTVKGFEYFQCEPNRGMFSRLHRLTRFPLNEDVHWEAHNHSTESHDQDDHDIIRRSHSTTPTGKNYRTTTTRYSKIPELVHYSDCKYSSPTRPSKIITTATTTTTSYKGPAGNVPLLGEHVTVNTSRGMLVGRVRYIGRTAFASGEWVGIELDEPYGKNDGSVSGRRYFTCPYKYGLFAPIHKVMRGDPVRTVTRTRVEYPRTTQFKL